MLCRLLDFLPPKGTPNTSCPKGSAGPSKRQVRSPETEKDYVMSIEPVRLLIACMLVTALAGCGTSESGDAGAAGERGVQSAALVSEILLSSAAIISMFAMPGSRMGVLSR